MKEAVAQPVTLGRAEKMVRSSTVAADDLSGLKIYYGLLSIIGLALVLPFWLVRYVPLLDYPNHLARTYVLYHYHQIPSFSSNYNVVLEPTPNLAIDLIVPLLERVFPVAIAGKIFLTITILLFVYGCHLLGRAIHGRPTWLSLSTAFIGYNSMLIWGFLNYLFGFGLFLITLAVWLNRRRQWSPTAFVLLCSLVFASYLAHLSAYIFLGVSFVIITFFDCLSARSLNKNMLLGLAPLIPPIFALLLFMKGSGEVGNIPWGSVKGKLINLAGWSATNNYLFDGAVAVTLIGIAGWLVLAAKKIEVRRAILATSVVFGILFLLCPVALFTSYSADSRFIAPAVVLALMAVSFEVSRRAGRRALILFLLVSAARLGFIYREWKFVDQKIASQVELFANFPEGARVYPITFFPEDLNSQRSERPIQNVIHYSMINQHTFVPTFFAHKGQQPVQFKERPEYLKIKPETPLDKVDWNYIFNNYDYLWCYRLNGPYTQFLGEHGELVAARDGGMIFRIIKNQR